MSKHIAHKSIVALRKILENNSLDIIPKMDLKLTNEEIKKGQEILDTLFSKNEKIIGLYTVATGLKEYPKSWWQELHDELKRAFVDYKFIEILPVDERSNISVEIPRFYSKNIREIASLIDNLEIFIAADCGIMHLAAATSTTTIGLFKVTEKEVYRPYGDKNMAIDTNGIEIKNIVNQIINN